MSSIHRQLTALEARIEAHHKRALAQEADANPDMAFLASELMQCTLPHSNPGKQRIFKRTNKLITLKIESGSDSKSDELLGIPYGVIPRLLLYYVNTQAIRKHSRRISFGRHLAEFMRKIGLDPDSRGKRSDYKRLIEQANRLFNARITFVDERDEARELPPRVDMLIAEAQDLWWTPHTVNQCTIWESYIELSERFYEAITKSPVPVNLKALRLLKRSPLALDLYGWVAYRVNAVNKTSKPLTIPLAALQEQFGADYRHEIRDEQGNTVTVPNRKEFNRRFRQAMTKIGHEVTSRGEIRPEQPLADGKTLAPKAYPALRYHVAGGAVTIFPTPTPIASKHL